MTVVKEHAETGLVVPEQHASREIDFIRIVNWNINRGLQLSGIVDYLRSAAADVILLQETDINARRTHYRNIPREIAQALRMHYVFGYEFEELTQGKSNSPAYHGQTTLSRLPICASRILRFHRQSGFWRPRWYIPKFAPLQRRLGARMALVSHIEWFEKQLVFYNVHLESRGTDELRNRQLQELFEDANRYRSEVPVVIAGDFNCDLSKKNSVEPFHIPFNHRAVQPTTQSRFGVGQAVDWVLIRGPIEEATPELHGDVRASDHFPISLALNFK